MYDASLIVTFYNKIDEFKLVLESIKQQTHKSFELIIADDGSNKEAVDELKRSLEHFPFDFQHIWHEDKGFRKTTILNKAVKTSRSDYLIFADGDCILHSKFVEEHVSNSEPRTVLAGKRVNLSKKITNKLTSEKVRKRSLERYYLFYLLQIFFDFHERRKHLKNGIYIRNKFIRKLTNKKRKGILGSNFSLFKEDILAVNGFDERYCHPAVGEDSDIRMRLEKNGVKIIPIKHIAVQYHLYHKILGRNAENMNIFIENKENNIIFTPHGINKHSDNEH